MKRVKSKSAEQIAREKDISKLWREYYAKQKKIDLGYIKKTIKKIK